MSTARHSHSVIVGFAFTASSYDENGKLHSHEVPAAPWAYTVPEAGHRHEIPTRDMNAHLWQTGLDEKVPT